MLEDSPSVPALLNPSSHHLTYPVCAHFLVRKAASNDCLRLPYISAPRSDVAGISAALAETACAKLSGGPEQPAQPKSRRTCPPCTPQFTTSERGARGFEQPCSNLKPDGPCPRARARPRRRFVHPENVTSSSSTVSDAPFAPKSVSQ